MENKITPELIAKAKGAKSAQELIAIAKENGTELTEESAKAYFDQLHKTGELADDELDNVAGGGCDGLTDDRRRISPLNRDCKYYACKICEQHASACKCRPRSEATCATCIHIRYRDDGVSVCNSLNVHKSNDIYN